MANHTLSRRDFMRTSAAGVVAATDIAKTKGNPVSKRRPNLLFIMTDQQPIRGVGAYGASVCRTPNIDRLAATGMRFDQFHVAAFPCSPSRATMLTGLYSHSHGHVTNDLVLTEETASLGTCLEKAGYNTGYVGKWHLGGNIYRPIENQPPLPDHHTFEPFALERVPDSKWFEFERVPGGTGEDEPSNGWKHWVGGWKHYRQYIIDKGMGEFVAAKWHLFGGHHVAPTFDGETVSSDDSRPMFSAVPEEHHECAFLADEATRFLEAQRNDDNPFALVLSFYGPHHPVAPPKPWDTMYGLDEVSLPDNFDDPLENKPPHQANDKYYRDVWTKEMFLDYIRRYWEYCSYIDEQIGKALRKLEEIGEADDTIVVFTSGHGDMVGGPRRRACSSSGAQGGDHRVWPGSTGRRCRWPSPQRPCNGRPREC